MADPLDIGQQRQGNHDPPSSPADLTVGQEIFKAVVDTAKGHHRKRACLKAERSARKSSYNCTSHREKKLQPPRGASEFGKKPKSIRKEKKKNREESTQILAAECQLRNASCGMLVLNPTTESAHRHEYKLLEGAPALGHPDIDMHFHRTGRVRRAWRIPTPTSNLAPSNPRNRTTQSGKRAKADHPAIPTSRVAA
ncbi:hypothetical protein C8J57DRAFT_1213128 [Mycena rebaudengoi]|nr:hypothetical protein C8J57DRAFT_1213128 [Mycena rebaudengoi]